MNEVDPTTVDAREGLAAGKYAIYPKADVRRLEQALAGVQTSRHLHEDLANSWREKCQEARKERESWKVAHDEVVQTHAIQIAALREGQRALSEQLEQLKGYILALRDQLPGKHPLLAVRQKELLDEHRTLIVALAKLRTLCLRVPETSRVNSERELLRLAGNWEAMEKNLEQHNFEICKELFTRLMNLLFPGAPIYGFDEQDDIHGTLEDCALQALGCVQVQVAKETRAQDLEKVLACCPRSDHDWCLNTDQQIVLSTWRQAIKKALGEEQAGTTQEPGE